MFESSYSVKAGAFEGPLDLLLDLIEKRKLHISDISLSSVTDDFIAHIKDQGNFPLGLSAHFILVASTLLLIKSKSLLPTIDLTVEEQQSIEDLERRLREYQRIKHLSGYVRSMFGTNVIYPRLEARREFVVFAPSPAMTSGGLAAAAHSVVMSFPKKEAKPQVTVKKVVSLEETIEKLTERITRSLRMNFSEFSGGLAALRAPMTYEEKVTVIVGFLAMLELAKQGIIAVTQNGMFDDIQMETQSVGLPHYM